MNPRVFTNLNRDFVDALLSVARGADGTRCQRVANLVVRRAADADLRVGCFSVALGVGDRHIGCQLPDGLMTRSRDRNFRSGGKCGGY